MAQDCRASAKLSEQEYGRRLVVELARKDPRVHEGELEIDDNAVVSWGSDNGAYVQAWLWVDFDGTQLDQAVEGDVVDASHD